MNKCKGKKKGDKKLALVHTVVQTSDHKGIQWEEVAKCRELLAQIDPDTHTEEEKKSSEPNETRTTGVSTLPGASEAAAAEAAASSARVFREVSSISKPSAQNSHKSHVKLVSDGNDDEVSVNIFITTTLHFPS